MTDLAERQCVPCRGGVPALTGAEIQPLAAQLPLLLAITVLGR